MGLLMRRHARIFTFACSVAAGVTGCAVARPVVAPMAEPPAAEPAPADPPPAPPAALPFHMPCAADDVAACTTGCDGDFAGDCVTLGGMYFAGTGGVSVDKDRAVELFRRACTHDSAYGCMRLADAYHAGSMIPPLDGSAPDPHAEEVTLYRRACEGGANGGCVSAGRALASGHGVARDPAQAARLFAPVCDRGNADGCMELAKLFRQGEGVKRDVERAARLFQKACGLGRAEACVLAEHDGPPKP